MSLKGASRVVGLAMWAFAVWVLVTWTLTVSQILFGIAISVAVAVACASLGAIGTPWSYLRPRRIGAVLLLAGATGWRVVRANCSLALRIWSPGLPLRSGMLVVPTAARSEGALTAVGLITSVIVDNQLVDLDAEHHELQYHAVWIGAEDPDENRDRINGPIEGRVQQVIDA